MADPAVPTCHRYAPIRDPQARAQVELLERNVRNFGLACILRHDARHGIVRVIGPRDPARAMREAEAGRPMTDDLKGCQIEPSGNVAGEPMAFVPAMPGGLSFRENLPPLWGRRSGLQTLMIVSL